MKTRKWSLGAFPVSGCDPFGTLCMFIHVQADGNFHLEAFIRIPNSDRPKVGGGKSCPRSWLNALRVSVLEPFSVSNGVNVEHDDNAVTV